MDIMADMENLAREEYAREVAAAETKLKAALEAINTLRGLYDKAVGTKDSQEIPKPPDQEMSHEEVKGVSVERGALAGSVREIISGFCRPFTHNEVLERILALDTPIGKVLQAKDDIERSRIIRDTLRRLLGLNEIVIVETGKGNKPTTYRSAALNAEFQVH